MGVNKFNKIKNRISKSDKRTKSVLSNIGISLCAKIASIMASLLIIPLTINYVNPTQYGLWLTFATVIGWVHFFDLGLGNGFRNKFAEALALGDTKLAKQYVSTTYITISIIVLFVYVIAFTANYFIEWSNILKVSEEYNEELKRVFAIVCAFTCAHMVANLFSTLLIAEQKPGYAAIISALGQYIALFSIYILTKTTEGTLTNLAIYYAGLPCIVVAVVSIFMYYFTRYRTFAPSFKYYRSDLIKNILKLGIQFFVIYICLIMIFQVVNLVITREIGPIGVTQYNVANRYFNIVYMAMTIIVTPIWSAFTEAYTKNDFAWMKSIVIKLHLCWFFGIIGLMVLMLGSTFIYKIWIGNSVEIPISLSIAMAVLIATQSLGYINMQMINGTGHVRIQLVTYVIFALISWPLFTLCARQFGLVGIVAIPALVYLTQGILGRIQINKIIKGTAQGIWKK